MRLKSKAFCNNEKIPSKYTCNGENISPPLKVEYIPHNTKSLALIAEDPDAPKGTFTHWVMYNIPPDQGELNENIPNNKTLSDGSIQGINSFGKTGYGGPCPPSGTHRYFFKLYALDIMLEQLGNLTKEELEDIIEGHILAEADLIGLYHQQK